MAKVGRLGGSVTEEDQGFSHFVCLSKRSGGSGFQRSMAALWALAKGAQACRLRCSSDTVTLLL